MNTPRFTPAEDAEIRRLLAELRTDPEIAAALGRSRNAVHKRRHRLGLKVRSQGSAPDVAAFGRAVADGLTNGESYSRIAAALGITPYAVDAIRRRLGLRPANSPTQTLRWSPAADDALRELWAAGVPVRHICRRLGRTNKKGVALRADKLGLPKRPTQTGTPRRLLPADAAARARAMYDAGLTDSAIVSALGLDLSPDQARYRVRRWRLDLGLPSNAGGSRYWTRYNALMKSAGWPWPVPGRPDIKSAEFAVLITLTAGPQSRAQIRAALGSPRSHARDTLRSLREKRLIVSTDPAAAKRREPVMYLLSGAGMALVDAVARPRTAQGMSP